MYNYKMLIQYDGSRYCGWQIQQNSISVQGTIVNSIKTIIGEDVNLIGSGRTDSGVHALGQVANFRTEQKLESYRFCYSLNSIMPPDISVKNMQEVPESYHSRFDAKKRSYLYLISKIKSPFFYNYTYRYKGELNIAKLNVLGEVLIGVNDFTSFCKSVSETENKVCKINQVHWREKGDLIIFFIEADRFLHGMVRAIAGTLLTISKSGGDTNNLLKILKSKNREAAGEAVPAKGLFLFKVKY